MRPTSSCGYVPKVLKHSMQDATGFVRLQQTFKNFLAKIFHINYKKFFLYIFEGIIFVSACSHPYTHTSKKYIRILED